MKRILFLLLVPLNVLAAGRDLAPRAYAPTSNYVTYPQAAFAGNRFLTVWTEGMGHIGYPVMGILHDANGKRISARAFPIVPAGAAQMQLVSAGDSFALFWSGGGQTYLTDVDRDGRVTRTAPIGIEVKGHVRIAWNGSRFLFVHGWYGDRYTVRAALLARSGAIVHDDIPIGERGPAFAIATFPDAFTLISMDLGRLCAQRISGAGAVVLLTCIDTTGTGLPRSAPLADGSTLISWAEHSRIRSAVIRPNGTTAAAHIVHTEDKDVWIAHLGASGDQFVVTFTREELPSEIRTLVIDAKGRAQSPVRSIAALHDRYNVAAASNGAATFAVFGRTDSWRSHGLLIAGDGTAIGAPEEVMIAKVRQRGPVVSDAASRLVSAWTELHANESFVVISGDVLARGELVSRELAWNGSQHLVLAQRLLGEESTFFAKFAEGGAEIPIATATLPAPFFIGSATWVSDRWLVVQANQTLGFSVSVIRNGALSSTRTIALNTPVLPDRYRRIRHIATARNATTTLVAWTEAHAKPCSSMPPCVETQYRSYVARLTPDGDLVDTRPLEIPSAGLSLSVATSGEEFVVLAEGIATVVSADARRVLRSTTIFGYDAAGDVAWDGSAYIVALRYKLARWYLATARLDRDGNIVGALRGIETLPAEEIGDTPSIAGSLIALQEGDPTDGARAVVYDEAELTALPPAPAHPVLRFERKDEYSLEVTWDPVPNAEIYVAEVEGRPWVMVFPADQPLRIDTETTAVRVRAVGPGGASSPPPRRRAARR